VWVIVLDSCMTPSAWDSARLREVSVYLVFLTVESDSSKLLVDASKVEEFSPDILHKTIDLRDSDNFLLYSLLKPSNKKGTQYKYKLIKLKLANINNREDLDDKDKFRDRKSSWTLEINHRLNTRPEINI
jgi:hypothetical protein